MPLVWWVKCFSANCQSRVHIFGRCFREGILNCIERRHTDMVKSVPTNTKRCLINLLIELEIGELDYPFGQEGAIHGIN